MRTFSPLFLSAIILVASIPSFAEVPQFKRPDPVIEKLVMSDQLPFVKTNGQSTKAFIGYMGPRYVPLEKVASSEVRVAGVRMDPKTFSETREVFYRRVEVLDVASASVQEVSGIPAGGEVRFAAFSPDGRTLAFTVTLSEKGTWLYKVDCSAAELIAKKVCENRVNTVFGNPFAFLDNGRILFKCVPQDLGPFPEEGMAHWPVVMENYEKKSIRTQQDLIKSPYDESVYDYCCTTELAVAGPDGVKTIAGNAVYRSYNASPDGNYIIVTTEEKPYSYIQGHRSFPSRQFIIDCSGNVVKSIQDGTVKKDKKDRTPKPSGFNWRPDKPATLYWTEHKNVPEPERDAKDADRPEKTFTDLLMQCEAPFNFESDKTVVLAPEYRMGQIFWCNDKIAFFQESSSKQKMRRLMTFVPCDTLAERKVLYTESREVDTLGNFPVFGNLYTVDNIYGRKVVWTDVKNRTVLMTGNDRRDAEGDKMSFIDRITLKNSERENIWMGQAPVLEKIISIVDPNRLKFISTRESTFVVPDLWETSFAKGKPASRQLTHFDNPVPDLNKMITRQFVTYTRKDGLKCYANLYLPAGYDKEKDGRLPVFTWAYPAEFACKAMSEKTKPGRYNFLKPNHSAAYIWVTQGYAVLQEFTMAIVAADKDSLPNNSFLEQLVMSAEAAVDFVVDSIGVGDRERIGVGGHSYGGFMTANLLAHTRLYKAGIARSGAYNRSLTPFGFQNEDRNYWKATDIYQEMSPFNYADKVKDAILLIHGQMDNNTGTFPVQSERMYQALVYFGAPARYLQLPYESHAYIGQETTLHAMYETQAWLEKYLKKEDEKK